jgi:hypothetical protein
MQSTMITTSRTPLIPDSESAWKTDQERLLANFVWPLFQIKNWVTYRTRPTSQYRLWGRAISGKNAVCHHYFIHTIRSIKSAVYTSTIDYNSWFASIVIDYQHALIKNWHLYFDYLLRQLVCFYYHLLLYDNLIYWQFGLYCTIDLEYWKYLVIDSLHSRHLCIVAVYDMLNILDHDI